MTPDPKLSPQQKRQAVLCGQAVMAAYRTMRNLGFSRERAADFVRQAAQWEEEAIKRGEP